MTVDPAILSALLSQVEQQQAFLAELVRTPSDNPPGDCARHAEVTKDLIEREGFDVTAHPVPADLCRAHGMVRATNLVLRRHYGDGPTLALNAHGDVVPPGEGWTADPYGAAVRDGVMYGRGVAVSKSDIATYLFALKALDPIADRLAGTVEIHVTYDEETGGAIGPKWLLDEAITAPDLAICAGFSYAVVTAHNGCLHLEVELRGRSAHAADPSSGADALEAASAVLSTLYAHRRTLAGKASAIGGIGAPNLVVGLIKGGINTNVVPDKVVLRLDRRIIPEEDVGDVEAGLRRIITEAAASVPGVAVDVRQVMLARPLTPLPGSERLIDLLQRHAQDVLGVPVTTSGVPLYTDARHYAERGIPTVLYGAGPRSFLEANAHRADEKLLLDDLTAATRVMAATLADLLQPG